MTKDRLRAMMREILNETLRDRPRRPRKARPDPLAPALTAFLVGRERVTLADVLPVLGFATATRAVKARAGLAMKAVGWRRMARESDPAGCRTWFYEPGRGVGVP